MSRRIGRLAATAALLAALGAPGAADAEELKGIAAVLEKDVAFGTVTLDDAVFVVTESTRLVDAGGRRITLAELPVAKRVQGAAVLSGESTVEYEATLRGEGRVLSSLRVLGTVPE